MFEYKTKGTCSKAIRLDIDGDTIKDVTFVGGCPGNTVGVALLAKGRKVDDVISIFQGVDCAGRGTSCPEQLSKALIAYKQSTSAQQE